jgi:hypothetical protein
LTKLETHQAKPRWAHSWATLSPVIGSLLRRFVGSKSFPSCLPASRYARPRLPSSGSLGSHFPTFTGTTLGYDYQLFFSMPYALARSPIPCLFPFVRVPFPARYRSGTLALTPGLLGLPVRLFRLSHKETDGSPKFPGYPFELMPCSSTPVVSSALALAYSGLLPSATMTTSAFPLLPLAVIHCPQLYNFRGSITRPALSLPLASDSRYRADPQGSLLTCWLDFGQAGFSPAG